MILRQVFKTSRGAEKRAAFENSHPHNSYVFHYRVVRYVDGERDNGEFNVLRYSHYTWRLERAAK